MATVVLELAHGRDRPRPLYASRVVEDIDVVPKVGDIIALYVTDPEAPWRLDLRVHAVTRSSDLGTYFARLEWPLRGDYDIADEFKVRRAMEAEGWQLHDPGPPLPPLADTDDLDED